jgi:hypothetical protein
VTPVSGNWNADYIKHVVQLLKKGSDHMTQWVKLYSKELKVIPLQMTLIFLKNSIRHTLQILSDNCFIRPAEYSPRKWGVSYSRE